MKKDWEPLEVLRHARHDWMNKLQLIQGNLALDKVDRVKEIINEIINEARQETRLSNLNLPKFASALLTCNWETHHFQLDYEVTDMKSLQNLDDSLLTAWMEKFMQVLDDSVERYSENYLSVTVVPEEQGVRIFLDFRGTFTNIHELRSFAAEETSGVLEISLLHESADELSLEVFTKGADRE